MLTHERQMGRRLEADQWIMKLMLGIILLLARTVAADSDCTQAKPYNYTYLVPPNQTASRHEIPLDEARQLLNDGDCGNTEGAWACSGPGTAKCIRFSTEEQWKPLLDLRVPNGEQYMRVTEVSFNIYGDNIDPSNDGVCSWSGRRRRRVTDGDYIRAVTLSGWSGSGPHRQVTFHKDLDLDGFGQLEYGPAERTNYWMTRRRTVTMRSPGMLGCVQFLEVTKILPNTLELNSGDEYLLKPMDPVVCEIVVDGTYDCGPPTLVLNPPLEQFMMRDTAWAEPGAECRAYDGTLLRYKLIGGVHADTEGSYLLKYECSDNGFSVTETRLVLVLRPPRFELMGDNVIRATDPQDFFDPQACCEHDTLDGANIITTFGPDLANNSTAGTVTYFCGNDILNVSIVPPLVKQVVVDQAPELTLIGDEKVHVTVEASLQDDGVRCSDPEEGWIPSALIDTDWLAERLQVVDVTSSSWTTSRIAPCDRPWPAQPDPKVMISGLEHSSASCCRECFSTGTIPGAQGSTSGMTKNGSHWIQFDLGAPRTVHEVLLFKLAATPNMTVRVGFYKCEDGAEDCGTLDYEWIGHGQCRPHQPGSTWGTIFNYQSEKTRDDKIEGCMRQCDMAKGCVGISYEMHGPNWWCDYHFNQIITGSVGHHTWSCWRKMDALRGPVCTIVPESPAADAKDRQNTLLRVQCKRPLAGRFITFHSTEPISICSAQVWGSAAPANPSTFLGGWKSYCLPLLDVWPVPDPVFRVVGLSADGVSPAYESTEGVCQRGHGFDCDQSNNILKVHRNHGRWCLEWMGTPEGIGISCEVIDDPRAGPPGTSSDLITGVVYWGAYLDGGTAWKSIALQSYSGRTQCSLDFRWYPEDACQWLFGNGMWTEPGHVCMNRDTRSIDAHPTYAGSDCDTRPWTGIGVAYCSGELQACTTGCKENCAEAGEKLRQCGSIEALVPTPAPPPEQLQEVRVRWHLTAGCDPDGEVKFSYAGRVVRESGQSGFCDCDDNGKRSFWEPSYTCADLGRTSCEDECSATLSPFRYQPRVMRSRVEVVPQMEFQTNEVQIATRVYTCTDSMGNKRSKTREVVVGCQSPNPEAPFPGAGGNNVSCQDMIRTLPGVASADVCAQKCLAESTEPAVCEAYRYNEGNKGECVLMKECDKRYDVDGDEYRQAAYCRLANLKPTLTLAHAETEVLWSDDPDEPYWEEPDPPCTCYDAEDPTQPECVSEGVVLVHPQVRGPPASSKLISRQKGGIYRITYSCTDETQQSVQATRDVVIRGRCIPPEKPNINSTEPCIGLGYMPIVSKGSTCTIQCEQGFTPSRTTLTCEDHGGWASKWQPDAWGCGRSPCELPEILNVRRGHERAEPCAENAYIDGSFPGCGSGGESPGDSGSLCILDGATCTPQCGQIGERWTPTEQTLQCSGGVLSPPTFECKKPAEKPVGLIAVDPGSTSLTLQWGTGKANDCTPKGYEVEHLRQGGIGADSGWQKTTGCLVTSPSCVATGLAEGGTYQFRVKRLCHDVVLPNDVIIPGTALESLPSDETSLITLDYVAPPNTIFLIPANDSVIAENPLQVLVGIAVPAIPVALRTTSGYGDFVPKPDPFRLKDSNSELVNGEGAPDLCVNDPGRCVRYNGKWYAALDGIHPDATSPLGCSNGLDRTESYPMPVGWDLAREPDVSEVAKAYPWAAIYITTRRRPHHDEGSQAACHQTSRSVVGNLEDYECGWISWNTENNLRSNATYFVEELGKECGNRILIEYMPRFYIKDATHQNCMAATKEAEEWKLVMQPCHDSPDQNLNLKTWAFATDTYPTKLVQGNFASMMVFDGEDQLCPSAEADGLRLLPCVITPTVPYTELAGPQEALLKQRWGRSMSSQSHTTLMPAISVSNVDCYDNTLTHLPDCNTAIANGVAVDWHFVEEVMVFKRWCMNRDAWLAGTQPNECDEPGKSCQYRTSSITMPILNEGVLGGSQAGGTIVGERILSAQPAPSFFIPGCVYRVVLHPHLLETIQAPPKVSDTAHWRFFYKDTPPANVPPFETSSIRQKSALVHVEYSSWTEFVCLASVAELNDCNLDIDTILEAKEAGCTCDPGFKPFNKPTCPGCCVYHWEGTTEKCCLSRWTTDTHYDQEAERYNVDIGELSAEEQHAGHELLPGYTYAVDCVGHLGGKPWIKTMPMSGGRNDRMFTTVADNDDSIRQVVFHVWFKCGDDIFGGSRQDLLRATELETGLTLIVSDWLEACDEHLPERWRGQLWSDVGAPDAEFVIMADVETSSELAIVSLKVGDGQMVETRSTGNNTISFSYGQEGGIADLGLAIQVCSFASRQNIDAYPCREEGVNIRVVDVKFTFNSISLNGVDTGAGLIGDVTVGEQMLIRVTTSDPDQNWGRVEIWLGCKNCSCSYLQATGSSSWTGMTQEFTFKLEGQGYDLPVIAYWQTAAFLSRRQVSFRPPQLHMHDLTASIEKETVLQAWVSNMPTPGHMVESCVIVKVFKAGTDANLCSLTTFVANADGNSTATCRLRPAALSNIEVQVLARTYKSEFEASMAESVVHSGKVRYPGPTMQGFQDPALNEAATQGNPIRIGDMAALELPQILVKGASLPKVSDVWLEGAAIQGYSVRFYDSVAEDAYSEEACRQIEWLNSSYLRCTLSSCLSVRYLPQTPQVYLHLGDLRNDISLVFIRLPSPVITGISPQTMFDTSEGQELVLNGTNFGQGECDLSRTDGIQLVGGATVEVGELGALCNVLHQTPTSLVCKVSGAIVYPRDYESPDDLPPVRRDFVTFFKFRLGQRFTSLNQDKSRSLLPLTLGVTLKGCPSGQKRATELSPVCVDCPLGRWSVADQADLETSRGLTSGSDWPLTCRACEGATYQDELGKSECKACPGNTRAASPKDSESACYCLPGYYSPMLDTARGRTISGERCVPCHDGDLTATPEPDEMCGENIPIASACTESEMPTCVRSTQGFRVCKAYCAGGTAWPLAKPTFFLEDEDRLSRRLLDAVSGMDTGRRLVSDSNGTETYAEQKTPTITRCSPKEACLARNQCSKKYLEGSYLCALCAEAHYPNQYTGKCTPCGIEQTIGTVVMSVVATIVVLGGVIGTSMALRLQADFQLRQALIQLFHDVSSNRRGRSFTEVLIDRILRREKRITIHLAQKDLGRGLRWSRHRDLGIVFRVAHMSIHVAGVLDGSPVQGTVQPNWKLLTINGKAVRAFTEADVKKRIAEEQTPLRLVFRDNALRHKGMLTAGDVADDRKMLIMLIGIMNAFQQISTMNFKWPRVFILIAEVMQQLSFNFNFFQPECSVSRLRFSTKWLATLAVPYCVSVPLVFSFFFVRKTMLSKNMHPESQKTKDSLLVNAFARTLCMAIIVFLPVHLDQLLIPIGCRNVGTSENPIYKMDASPDVQCSSADSTWTMMLTVSFFGFLIVAAGTTFLFMCIFRSYYWQYGALIRKEIPFYVGITEVSAFGQKGYSREVRTRVHSNVMAVKAFEIKDDALSNRAQLFRAAGELGARSRWVQEAAARRGRQLHPSSKMQARFGTGMESEKQDDGSQLPEEVQRMQLVKGRKYFLQQGSGVKHDGGEGSILTYGWIFFINLYCRQLLTLVTIKLSKTNLVVVGAGVQILIFAANIALLFIYRPYKAEKITVVETCLLVNLSAMLWCAVLQDLLLNHINAHLYEKHINRFNMMIEGLAVALVAVLCVVPVYQVWLIVAKTLAGDGDPTDKLNELYFVNSVAKENSTKNESIMKQDEKEIEAAVKEHMEKMALQRRANALRAVLDGKVVDAIATDKEREAASRLQAAIRGWLVRRKMDELRTRARERIKAREALLALEAARQQALEAQRRAEMMEQSEVAEPEAARAGGGSFSSSGLPRDLKLQMEEVQEDAADGEFEPFVFPSGELSETSAMTPPLSDGGAAVGGDSSNA